MRTHSTSPQDATNGSHAATDGPVNLDDVRIDPVWAIRAPTTLVIRKRVLPLCEVDGHVLIAAIDEPDDLTLHALERRLEMPLRVVLVDPDSLQRAQQRIYGGLNKSNAADANASKLRRDARPGQESDDAVSMCDELFHAAILRGASDMHFVPSERIAHVRFRVDGKLESHRELPLALYHGVVSRFKVLAEMDIAEKRAPQDGRFSVRTQLSQERVDVRAATLPTKYGERMTLRLLTRQAERLTFPRLGMSVQHMQAFRHAIQRPHGLVLLTGPTGSGKSTTLYTALQSVLDTKGGNVVTIEDPIEYEIAGVSQVEVDSVDKVNFQKALRSVIRHDPDVLMIGEIRDGDTADVAIKAALTGHLVFSTLHTNSAAGVVTRLVDMGLARYLVGATLRMAVAQRLVRRLCAGCRKPRTMQPSEAAAFERPELAGATVYEAGQCLYCAGRGYSGRIALFELLPIDESLAREITNGADEPRLLELMREREMSLLLDDAIEKLLAGEAEVQDVLAAVNVW